MAKKLKCPFCGAELQETFGAYMCRHAGCKICCCLLPPCMIESLIQAKQDLEIARKALGEIIKEHTGTDGKLYACSFTAHQALEQIEHKEKTNDK